MDMVIEKANIIKKISLIPFRANRQKKVHEFMYIERIKKNNRRNYFICLSVVFSYSTCLPMTTLFCAQFYKWTYPLSRHWNYKCSLGHLPKTRKFSWVDKALSILLLIMMRTQGERWWQLPIQLSGTLTIQRMSWPEVPNVRRCLSITGVMGYLSFLVLKRLLR